MEWRHEGDLDCRRTEPRRSCAQTQGDQQRVQREAEQLGHPAAHHTLLRTWRRSQRTLNQTPLAASAAPPASTVSSRIRQGEECS